MKTDEPQIGIVIESYLHGENQVVIAQDSELQMQHFFFLPKHPDVNFGDTILMNFYIEKYWVHHGNPRLTYRVFPLEFPGTLLWELLFDKMNN